MDVETALTALEHHLAEARPLPLSSSVMVNKEEVEHLIAAVRQAMPEELRRSRWVLKERDELLAQAAREAEQIVADGKLERDRLVSETEVVRAAEREAQRIVQRGEEEARQLRLQAEDYIDAKLADFEALLNKTLTTVTKGRERLRGRLAIDDHTGDMPVQHTGELPADRPMDPAVSGELAAQPEQAAHEVPAAPPDPPEQPAARPRGVRFYDHETM